MSGMNCRAPVPPTGDVCPNTAEYKITFPDEDKTKMCEDHALALRELMGASIKIERIK
jgi:hypothetical protein